MRTDSKTLGCAQCQAPLTLLRGIIGWRSRMSTKSYWFCSLRHLLDFAGEEYGDKRIVEVGSRES
jgi:hypothetical protein